MMRWPTTCRIWPVNHTIHPLTRPTYDHRPTHARRSARGHGAACLPAVRAGGAHRAQSCRSLSIRPSQRYQPARRAARQPWAMPLPHRAAVRGAQRAGYRDPQPRHPARHDRRAGGGQDAGERLFVGHTRPVRRATGDADRPAGSLPDVR